MMNPEAKEKWLTALRSGHYAQGRVVLRSENDRYCCLGVLAHEMEPDTRLNNFNYTEFEKPEYGLTTEQVDFLWHANDGIPTKGESDLASFPVIREEERWTFSEIADWIEEHL